MEYKKISSNEIIAIENNKTKGTIGYNLSTCDYVFLILEYHSQRLNIGNKLIQLAEKELKNKGCKKAYVGFNNDKENYYDIHIDLFEKNNYIHNKKTKNHEKKL